MEKTSNWSNTLLWFGAAVSIAEILSGTLFAPLGFAKGITAIIVGHVIGIILFYLAGLIGAKSGLAAIESSRISFGKYGSYGFSVLNILQLVGWTAVMIIGAASVLTQIAHLNDAVWCLIIGALIILWVLVGIKNLGKLNVVAVGGLFALTVVLSFVVFGAKSGVMSMDNITFGGAVELSVAMPLSWLPLISDYTRFAKKPIQATLFSSISYFFGSSWMYIIGLGAAIYAGTNDISQIIVAGGLGIIGFIIVVLATVTTTFLDVYSAGVSATNISKKISEKGVAVVVCVIGTLIAIFIPLTQYENFLYLIASVFAPMAAILITDYFILKKSDAGSDINIPNIIIWVVGFALYRKFMSIDTVLGSTVPVMIIISIICIVFEKGRKLCLKK